MADECEHLDGSIMGTCAICGETVCSECFRSIFNQIICSRHEALEDESAWELIGLYTSEASLEERRFFLEEQGITSIVVETEEDMLELYVPEDDKEDACAALLAASEETLFCPSCHIHFAPEMQVCPLCGVKPDD